MTITIPTCEFTGLIADVAPFAFPKDDLPDVNCVRIEWDGQMLHASATDTVRSARSTWHPDDEIQTAGGQDHLFPAYGGTDPRWVVIVALADAAELVKIYKLPAKEGLTPLTLDVERGRLKVTRSRDTGHSAITTVPEPQMVEFPDLRKTLDVLLPPGPVDEIRYTGGHLAALGLVRQRGVMQLRFAGRIGATRVTIGERFVAVLRPDRTGEREAQMALSAVEG